MAGPPPPNPPPANSGNAFNPHNTQATFSPFRAGLSSFQQANPANVAAQSALDGLSSVASRAYSIGASIGENILKGVFSPFGRTGDALSSVSGTALRTGGALLSNGLGIAGGIVGAGAQVALGAATMPYNLAAGALTALGSAIPIIGGVASGLGSLVTTATSSITNLFSMFLQGVNTLASKVGDSLGKIGELGGAIFSGALTIAQDVLSEVRDTARTIRSISFNAGISQGASANLVNVYGGAGVSTQQLSGLYNQPFGALTIGMRAKMMGLPDPTTDPAGFLMGGAKAYQNASRGGMGGAAMFNALLGPQLSGAFGSSFSLGPERLQRNIAMSRAFQIPATTGALGGDIESAENIISAFGRNVKLVIGESLLALAPMVTSAFSWLIENKNEVVGAVRTAGNWLFIEMPKMVLSGSAFVLRGVSGLMTKLGDFLQTGFQGMVVSVVQNLPGALKAFDAFGNSIRALALAGIAGTVAISQALLNLSNSSAGQWIKNKFGFGGGAPGANTGTGGSLGPQPQQGPSAPPNALNPHGAPNGTNYNQVSPGPPTAWQHMTGTALSAVTGVVGGIGGFLLDVGMGVDKLFNPKSPPYEPFHYTQTWAHNAASAGYYAGSGGYAYPTNGRPSRPQTQPPTQAVMPGASGPSTLGYNALLPQPGQSIGGAYTNANAYLQGLIPTFNTQSQQANISNWLTGTLAPNANDAGGWLKENASKPEDWANSLDRMSERWGKTWDSMDNKLGRIDGNTSRMERALMSQPQMFNNFAAKLISRTAANIVEDFSMNALRI